MNNDTIKTQLTSILSAVQEITLVKDYVAIANSLYANCEKKISLLEQIKQLDKAQEKILLDNEINEGECEIIQAYIAKKTNAIHKNKTGRDVR